MADIKTSTPPNLWADAHAARAKLAAGCLEFARAVHALVASGVAHPDIARELSISRSLVKQLARIGGDPRVVSIANQSLPVDTTTVYLLTTLDDVGFAKLAKPGTTRQMVKDYKTPRRIAPTPPPRPEPPRVPADFSDALVDGLVTAALRHGAKKNFGAVDARVLLDLREEAEGRGLHNDAIMAAEHLYTDACMFNDGEIENADLSWDEYLCQVRGMLDRLVYDRWLDDEAAAEGDAR